MKQKQTNLSNYMNFTKKNKSSNKIKYKTVIPNYIDSYTNKYPNFLQSSLNEDIFLLKKKLKGYSKIHSHSSNNTNKNTEVNSNKNNKMVSDINSISPVNNYLIKKKKDNPNTSKPSKNHLMLSSINNSSIIYSNKEKGLSYSINNISNYQSNNNNNGKNLYNNNVNKRSSFKNKSNHNSNYKKQLKESEVLIQKNINFNKNQFEQNIIKKNAKNKKYSLTSMNSRKNSIDKDKGELEIVKKYNKINFNGLFSNSNNFNNKINNNNSSNINNKVNKNLFNGELINMAKKGKLVNNFLETYLKDSQRIINQKIKKDMNITNSNSNFNYKLLNINNNHIISVATNQNNNQFSNFPSSNYSPINGNKFYKTAKISPRSSYLNKKPEVIQSHRINVKNKISENILSFYNNYQINNINSNNGSTYGNDYNINSKINFNDYNNSNNKAKDGKKGRKNMSVNMDITYNNKNYNVSNLKGPKNLKNKSITNNNTNNFNKSSSVNKTKKNNYIENYSINYNVNNNIKDKYSNGNSFAHKKNISCKTINDSKHYNNESQIINGNNIINNCEININNINYNNYNPNIIHNSNKLISEKIFNLFNKKSSLQGESSNKINKIFSQSQPEIIQSKEKKYKNFRTNNSPINKNNNANENEKKIKVKNSNNIKNNINNNNNNSPSKVTKNFIINYYNNGNNSTSQNNIESTNSTNVYVNKITTNSNKSIQVKKSTKEKDYSNHNSKENLNINKLSLKSENINKKLNQEDNNNAQKKHQKNKTNVNFEHEILELKQNLQKNASQKAMITKNSSILIQNTISNMSSTTYDSNYYMEKCNALSKYIRDYYKNNNEYPNTDLNFYLYGRLIGQGAFGKVNIGLNILTGRVVAIKSFNKKTLNKNGDNMKKILYETNLMKKLNHPNITKILEMFEDDDYILIAMEYINGGNLFSFVKKRRKLSEKTAKFLFRQIILGIKHIHSQKIVHRDIKLENILIDLNNNIKICDFGIGRILSSKKQILHDKCGTPMYMAPEILLATKNKGYEGFPVDVWSSGISLYIMLSGTLPFNYKSDNNSSSINSEDNDNNIELQYNIIHKEPKKIEKISNEARDLLRGILNKNPNQRLTIDEILNHPWLKSDEKNLKCNKKYHLFTKAEMIMLSKTYIDYRNGLIEDLKENFTISNLKIEKDLKKGEKKIKNITTKSSLLAPYNTLIQENESYMEYESQDSFDDLNNPNINFENDILIFNNKIKEYNLNYELNNNGECDNGVLINTKTGTLSSSAANNSNCKEGQLTSRSRRRNENEENEFDEDVNGDDDIEEEQEKKRERILNQIEKIGYDKQFVMNCVNNNILCHASAIYYLMYNYENI